MKVIIEIEGGRVSEVYANGKIKTRKLLYLGRKSDR